MKKERMIKAACDGVIFLLAAVGAVISWRLQAGSGYLPWCLIIFFCAVRRLWQTSCASADLWTEQKPRQTKKIKALCRYRRCFFWTNRISRYVYGPRQDAPLW